MVRIRARKRNIELSVIGIEVILYGGLIKNMTKWGSIKREKQRAKDGTLGYTTKERKLRGTIITNNDRLSATRKIG